MTWGVRRSDACAASSFAEMEILMDVMGHTATLSPSNVFLSSSSGCICFSFFVFVLKVFIHHFIHHPLQKPFSSLATYHHSRIEDGVSQSFLCCICFLFFFISFVFDLHISLYFTCICFVFPLYHHSGAQGGLSHNFLCCALRGAPVNIGRLVRCAQ